MTPFPHPYGHSTLDLQVNDKDKDRMIVETIRIVLPADKLAALVAIAGTLNGSPCSPGWVQFKGGAEVINATDVTNTIPWSTAFWLCERGLLEREEMAWHETYQLSSRAKTCWWQPRSMTPRGVAMSGSCVAVATCGSFPMTACTFTTPQRIGHHYEDRLRQAMSPVPIPPG